MINTDTANYGAEYQAFIAAAGSGAVLWGITILASSLDGRHEIVAMGDAGGVFQVRRDDDGLSTYLATRDTFAAALEVLALVSGSAARQYRHA